MKPAVYLLVLSWNMHKDTIECIESLNKLKYENYKILIIDNASSDDSVKILRERFPSVEVIQNSENLGFAEGNNVGMRYALSEGADYVFILNNDLTLDEDSLSQLIDAAQNMPLVGMLAPKVYYYDYPKIINSLGTSMNWFKLRPYLSFCGQEDNGQFTQIREVQILVGCALLVKKETIERIGLIDKDFFIFHEEADWCLRNLKSGYKNVVVPSAMAYHKASLTMKNFSSLTNYYNIRNFLYLTKKNASLLNKIKVISGLCFLVCKNILFLLSVSQKKLAYSFFSGVIDYFKGNMGRCKRTF